MQVPIKEMENSISGFVGEKVVYQGEDKRAAYFSGKESGNEYKITFELYTLLFLVED